MASCMTADIFTGVGVGGTSCVVPQAIAANTISEIVRNKVDINSNDLALIPPSPQSVLLQSAFTLF